MTVEFETMVIESSKAQKQQNARMSLLFWQGKGAKGAATGAQASTAPNGRNWIHAPDVLLKGHVAYLVKFLGTTTVDQPKGIEVVKEAIRKLQFAQQLKRSDASSKTKKVEITISVDGVAIQEPRTSNILHQFPLHRISYCADDKGAKKFFSFIAKSSAAAQGDSAPGQGEGKAVNGTGEEQHECFVFVSTKLASEITLTIGQAFDLAYRRFLTDNGKYMEMQKLQLQNKRLELQVAAYRTRLQDLARMMYKDDVSAYMGKQGLRDIADFAIPQDLQSQISAISNGFGEAALAANGKEEMYKGSGQELNNLLLSTPPPVHHSTHNGNSTRSPSNHINDFLTDLTTQSKNPSVGTKLEGLLLNSDSDSDFDPRACESDPPMPTPVSGSLLFAAEESVGSPPPASPAPLLAPPPKTWKRQNNGPAQPAPTAQPQPLAAPVQNGTASDLFGSTPFSVQPTQPTNVPHPAQGMQYSSRAPNYDISDFNMSTSVFGQSHNTSFTNGLAGFDPLDAGKVLGNGSIFSGAHVTSNSNGAFNSSAADKHNSSVTLDSNFSGFLDKRISEMKDGFSRGISFGNDDFSADNLDPFRKN